MKKMICMLLVMTVLATLVPGTFVLAADPSGEYYKEWGIWFDKSTGTITDCDGSVKELVLPSEIDGVVVRGIGTNAFGGCGEVKKITIPNSVTTIGWQAFSNCDSLQTIAIPKSIVSATSEENSKLRGNWFTYCDNLREIIFEYGTERILAECIKNTPELEAIIIPETVVSIEEAAFSYCPKLQNAVLPTSLNTIPSALFDNCSGITEIIIPDSVTIIGSYAFSLCSSLKEITIPNSVTEIGAHAFGGCGEVKEITIPNSVTTIGMSAFEDCDDLVEVTIPKSVTDGGGYWFAKCDSLKRVAFEYDTIRVLDHCLTNVPNLETVVLPNTIQAIESEAISYCPKLTNVVIPNTVKQIASNTFWNTPNVLIYCSESLSAVAQFIDEDIKFSLTEEISSYEHFEFWNTDYRNTTDSFAGYVPFEMTYQLKDGMAVSNMQAVLRIPSNTELMESTLKVNGVIATNYSYANNLLTVPVEGDAGTIAFCVKPSEYNTLLTYAKMEFVEKNERKSEVIGVVNCSMPTLSVRTDEKTSNATVKVEGIAPPSGNVDLYVDDTHVGSVSAKKTGGYNAEIVLPNPENYKDYMVTAKTNHNGSELSADASVMYKEAAPELKSLIMQYRGSEYDLTASDGKKPTVTFASGNDFVFRATFENKENIDKVYIVSTRNNQRRFMDAAWDESEQAYVAKGRFEGTDMGYVPGQITVEYTEKRPTVPIRESVNASELIGYMDNSVAECTVDVKTNTDTSYEATVNVSEKLSDLIGDEIDFVVTTVDKEYSAIPVSDLMSTAKDYYSYFIEEDGEKYVLNLDLTDPKTINMVVHDIAGNKQLHYMLDFMDKSTPGNPSKALAVSEVLDQIGTVTGAIADVYDIEDDDAQLRDNIMASGMSAEEKEEALKKADELKRDRELFLTASMVITVATMGFGGAPALVFGLLFGAVTTSSSFFWDMRMANITGTGTGFACNWAIDPSGYVYEAVPSNRVAGVTATAYWIAPEYIDENGVGDETKAVLWDAAEYEQMNPLTTDANGQYAWDVPEGLWQVRFEKAGYESLKTEWLPVPPPQTEVNVGMYSALAPEIAKAEWNGKRLKVVYSKPILAETAQHLQIVDAGGNAISATPTYTAETDIYGSSVCQTVEYALSEPPALVRTGDAIKSYANTGMAVGEVYVASLAAPAVKLELQIGVPIMSVNGQSAEIDPGRGTVPFIQNGRTLLPIRAVVESFGAEVAWDDAEQKVSIYTDATTIQMWIGSNTAIVNGETRTIDVAPVVVNGRTFMPIRFIAESLGLTVGWNELNQTVTVAGAL